MTCGILTKEYTKNIGKRIKTLRKKLGITQVQLAEQIGVYPTTIHYIEIGRNLPLLLNAASIAKTLKISMDELFRQDEANIPL